jgi:hypothetical protein
MEHFVLERANSLSMHYNFRLGLGETAGFGMQTQQAYSGCWRRFQDSGCRQNQVHSRQRPGVGSEFLCGQDDQAPLAGSARALMDTPAAAPDQHVARTKLHAAPYLG